MKQLLKSIAKKVLFGRCDPISFPAVRIPTGHLREKFILRIGDAMLDVTLRHCIACHSPFSIAICLTDEERSLLDTTAEAIVAIDELKQASIRLSLASEFQIESNCIVVFRVEDAKNFQLGEWRQSLMRKYFKNKNTLH